MVEIEKGFVVDSTRGFYKRLKDAVAISGNSSIHRVWLRGSAIFMHCVRAEGEKRCAVAKADKLIKEAIENRYGKST